MKFGATVTITPASDRVVHLGANVWLTEIFPSREEAEARGNLDAAHMRAGWAALGRPDPIEWWKVRPA